MANTLRFSAVILTGLMFGYAPAYAATLTADDYVEVRNLYALYTQDLDFGADDRLAALFTSDGTISSAASGHKPRPVGKSPRILEAKGVRHFVTNVYVVADGNAVIGRCYGLVLSATPDKAGVRGMPETYRDRLVKTADGWRFKNREFWTAQEAAPGGDAPPPPNARAAATGKALSAEDSMQINQLYAAYGAALDRNDGAALAALFAPGGTFASDNNHHAPESVGAMLKRGLSGRSRHFLMNLLITPTPEGIKAGAYTLIINNDVGGDGRLRGAPGLYSDTLVKTQAGWRFKSREFWTAQEPMPPPDFAAVKNDKFVPDAKAMALPSQEIHTLTPEDYFQIWRLYADYAFATDLGDGPRRSKVFTADATITSNLTDHKPGSMADMVRRTGRIGAQARPMGGHIMSNIALTPSAKGVRGVAYAFTGAKANPGDMLSGTPIVYNDLIVRTPVGWRIQARNIWLDNEADSPFHPGRCARNPCGPLSPFKPRKDQP